jgi:hypothetical protein
MHDVPPTRFLGAWLAATAAMVGLASAQAGLAGVVTTIDGRRLDGALHVGQDGRATVTAAGAPAVLEVAELAGFEPTGVGAAPADALHRVWLRSGAELIATRLGGKARRETEPSQLVVETPSGLVIELPLGMVRALRHGGDARPEPALFRSDLQRPAANEDALFVVKDGKAQRSLVTVTGLGERVDFLLRGEAYDFELAGVAAIVFGANTGFAPDRQPKPRSVIELVTGERYEGRLLTLDATQLRCRLDEGVELAMPSQALLRIVVASDRLAWLGDLQPQVAQTAAFDRIWPWTVDRAVAGPGLVVGGKRFQRGLCLVPKTRLTYDLGGRFDVFEASIGIDDRGGPESHAVFRVFVDDKLAFESTGKIRGEPAEALRIALQKAKSLAIEVDFGRNFDLGDYCVFADARVLQQ